MNTMKAHSDTKKSHLQNAISLIRCIGLLLLVHCAPTVFAHHPAFQPTEAEEEYLKQLGPVTMCVDPDWRPLEYIDQKGNYSGIAADLINLISQRTGIEFKLIPTASWEESLQKSQQDECMILACLNQTVERNKWLLFTNTYFSDHNVLITREEHDDITKLSRMRGNTIALPSGTSIEERIRKNYPNLKIILFNNEEEAFKAVNDRKADMTIRSLTMAAHHIKSQGWFNLKIAGQLHDFTNEFKIGVSQSHPLLRTILNKAILTLDETDVRNAINNHVTIKVVDNFNYAPIIQLSIVLIVLISIGFIWNYQLRQLNQRLQLSQKELIKLSEQQEDEISHRKQAEVKLRSSEQQLNNLISNLPGFVYRCCDDPYYTMQLISEGCYAITGYQPSDFINNNKIPFSSLILPEELQKIHQKWEIATIHNSHFEHEYRIKNANGEIRWIWERGYVTYDELTNQKILEGFITDITDRKLAESELRHSEDMLRELNAQKDKFFSIIAHDLRSPFTAIVGFSELLAQRLESKDYEGIEDYVEMILKSSKKTLDLLMNLLEWARSQTGRISFNPEYFELKEVVDETAFILANMAGHKSITINKELSTNIVVYADRQMLSTIMRNLVSNAVKFTPSGGSVTVQASRAEHSVIIQVTDTGIGISANRIERLFRIDSNETTLGTNEEEGTGLGLVLCKEFTERHGGTLVVESEPGKGSVFTLTLPLRL